MVTPSLVSTQKQTLLQRQAGEVFGPVIPFWIFILWHPATFRAFDLFRTADAEIAAAVAINKACIVAGCTVAARSHHRSPFHSSPTLAAVEFYSRMRNQPLHDRIAIDQVRAD